MTGERIAAFKGNGEMPREAPGKEAVPKDGKTVDHELGVGNEPGECGVADKERDAMVQERGKTACMDLGL